MASPPKVIWLPLGLVVVLGLAWGWFGPRCGHRLGPPPPEAILRDPVPPPPPLPILPPAPQPPPDPLIKKWHAAVTYRDKDGVVAAQSEFRAREDEFREPLIRLARDDRDPRIRAFTTSLLGSFTAPPPESFFIERLSDASEHPRVSALEALKRLGTRDCLAAVDRLAASDPVESVRAVASQTDTAVRSR